MYLLVIFFQFFDNFEDNKNVLDMFQFKSCGLKIRKDTIENDRIKATFYYQKVYMKEDNSSVRDSIYSLFTGVQSFTVQNQTCFCKLFFCTACCNKISLYCLIVIAEISYNVWKFLQTKFVVFKRFVYRISIYTNTKDRYPYHAQWHVTYLYEFTTNYYAKINRRENYSH